MMTIVCFGAGFLFHLGGKTRLRNKLGFLGLLLLSASVIAIILAARRMPLYGMFESMTTVLWTTATVFFILSQVRKSKAVFSLFYAIITFARNPVHEIFFIFYALMIATLIVYTVTKAYEFKI